MLSPAMSSSQKSDLRAFIRATRLSSDDLIYFPPNDSQLALPLPTSKSATFSRSTSAPLRPGQPIRRTSSFANLLNMLRRPSLSYTADTVSTRAGPSLDLEEPASPRRYQPYRPGDVVDIPQRSTSLSWLPPDEPLVAVSESRAAQVINAKEVSPLELEVAAELQETFREWEERFGLGREEGQASPLQHTSPTIVTSPPSPDYPQLLTPGPITYDSLSPLRSQFSCDSDDDERSAVLEVVRSRDARQQSSPGSIGRLTRKMSSAIALSLAQKTPLMKRIALGQRRDTSPV